MENSVMKNLSLSKLVLGLGTVMALVMPIQKSQAGIGLTTYLAFNDNIEISGIGLYGIFVGTVGAGAIIFSKLSRPLGVLFMVLDEKTSSNAELDKVAENIVNQLPDIDEVSADARRAIKSATIYQLKHANFKPEDIKYNEKNQPYVDLHLSMPVLASTLLEAGDEISDRLYRALN